MSYVLYAMCGRIYAELKICLVWHTVVKDGKVIGREVETREPLFFPDLAQKHYDLQCVPFTEDMNM